MLGGTLWEVDAAGRTIRPKEVAKVVATTTSLISTLASLQMILPTASRAVFV